MPAGFNQPTSDTENVVGVQFGIFSPDEIVRRSVVEITSQNTYDGNEPKIGGLFDPRMGVLDNDKTCRSCGQTNHGCPGHFGHYRLARPVYFIQFMEKIRDVLRCVCIRCSKLLIDKNEHQRLAKRRGEARWKMVKELCDKVHRCGQETEDGCGTLKPSRFITEGIARIVAEWDIVEGTGDAQKKSVSRQPLEVEYVLRLFKAITDEDVDFMGFSRYWCRPDWMICQVLPIPPPQVRPSVVQDNNQRSEDDLTHKLVEIIKRNKILQDLINKNENRNVIDENTTVLQYHVATLVDNKIPGVAPSAQRGGRPLKSLQQRIGSKEGRVRFNIQGKRVEQSARSVITGDPNISIAEVGVPMKIAMNLTRPEQVTKFNRDRLYKYVQNGASVFPGAKSIVRKDGRMISLKHVNTKEIELHYGDTVNRHLMDGDIILFNRQPTLHRMSMMGHRVRVLPYNTFRLNVLVTRPYNADFDGDEMNAHIPQSYEATAELAEIAAVPMQIIRPRDSTPVIGVTQDALAGAYLATLRGNEFTRREYMNMMMKNKRFREVPAPRENGRYTGQQIIGTLLAPINLTMPNKMYKKAGEDGVVPPNNEDNMVEIREGEFIKGVLDKAIFNTAGKGILHTTYNDYGPKAAVELLDGLQSMIETYLIMKGFSVGISDLIANESTKDEMDAVIVAKKKELDDLLMSLHTDLFTNNSGKSNQEEFEARANAIMNQALAEAGKKGVQSLPSQNRLMTMVRSGSKGDEVNVGQMISCLGQVNVEGKRIPYGFTDRTLPHFKMYDDGAEARGFVQSSFMKGLTPTEFFFHAMSGREGLIDTAVKTADTGYTQRQLIKAMENLMCQHDGTVRDGMGKIVQFRYGEDGLASTKLEGVTIPLAKLSNIKIEKDFGMDGVDFTTILEASVTREADQELVKDYVKQVIQDRDILVKNVYGGTMGEAIKLTAPLNLERIILNMKIKFNLQKDGRTDLTPMKVIEDINNLIERTQPYNKIWAANVRFHLAPHRSIVQHRFTKLAWDTMLETILVKDWKAWALPGELVGIVAAQSIGEPATQMSCTKSTKIVVNDGKNMHYKGAIGTFIDDILAKYKSDVVTIGEDSVVLDLAEDVYITGVSTDEKTSWRRISQVSRHPANGGLVEVRTRSGRKTTATLSHSFLRRSTKGIVPVLGSDLKVGMRIPVARSIPEVSNPVRTMKKGDTTFTLDREFGWLCGMYLSDGGLNAKSLKITKMAVSVEERLRKICETYKWEFSTRMYDSDSEYGPCKENILHSKDLRDFMEEQFSKGSYGKNVGAFVFNTTVDFIRGVVGGYFDGDGNVNAMRQMLRAGSRSKELIEDIAQLLGYCGMFGVMGEEKTVHMPGKILYTVNVPRKFAYLFKTTIGLSIEEKAVELDKIIEYNFRENPHSYQEMIDMIPEVGQLIADTGRLLNMPECSRTYGRWAKKEYIGRRTLGKYIRNFKDVMEICESAMIKEEAQKNIAVLDSAYNAEVFWDEITDLVYLDDPKEYVYDFTVPGNDSFMVDNNILVHNTLNTFHQAGVSSKSAVTRGVPRLKELLKVTKNPKATSVSIALKPAFRNDKDMVRQVSQDLELTLLKDIVRKAAIYYDSTDEETIIEEDRDLIKFFKEMEVQQEDHDEAAQSKWILRFEFDREKMFNKNITMDDVNFVIQDAYGYYASDMNALNIIYSDYNSQKLVMRIRPQFGGKFMFGDELAGIKKFLSVLLNNTIIRGVAGIRAVTWRKDANRVEFDNGEYKKVDQFILDTDGSNFVAVMTHPIVDGTKLYSTNIHDIYEQLGIEATRNVLYSEISSLFNPDDINYRHLGLLCDVMTHAGKPMSVDRYGINKMDSGPLAKACFEETEKVLKNAALFGEMDPVTGVSANIMMGQPIRAGTAFTQILLDEDALPKLMEGLPDVEEEEEDEGPTQEQIDEQLYGQDRDACAQLETQMNMILPDPDANLRDEDDIEIIEVKAESS